MKIPTIFFHYWNSGESKISFQEILQWEVEPSIMQAIQDELLDQLTQTHIQTILPNFPWESPRFIEKWASMSQSLVLQVQLPEQIWIDWIQQLGGNIVTSPEEIPAAPREEVYPTFEELLTAEIYYERPSDSLEDIEDSSSTENTITQEIDIPVVMDEELPTFESAAEASPSEEPLGSSAMDKERIEESIEEDKPEEPSNLPNTETLHVKSNEAISEPIFEIKNIMEMYAESPEERVFESIKTEDPSLKDRIHTHMTSSLAETLPLFQKINYIQHLFDGQTEHLDHIIRYIDHEYAQEDWKAYLNERYAAYQRAENAEIWQELFDTIERKFS